MFWLLISWMDQVLKTLDAISDVKSTRQSSELQTSFTSVPKNYFNRPKIKMLLLYFVKIIKLPVKSISNIYGFMKFS